MDLKTRAFPSLFLLLVLAACTNPKHDSSNSNTSFPTILDTLDFEKFGFREFRGEQASWFSTGKYRFLYIGPARDSLYINPFLRYRQPPPPPPGIEPEHLTFKHRNPLEGYSIPWDSGVSFHPWSNARVHIQINTDTTFGRGYPVLLTNLESDTISIGYGSYIPLVLEAQDSSGVWKPIQGKYMYLCGVGVGTIVLPPAQVVLTLAPQFEGSFQTSLRLRLGENLSNEFEGSIHPRQFERKFDERGNYKEAYKLENNIQ